MNMAIEARSINRRQGVSLEVRQKLEDFLVHYCHTLDDDNLEQWPDLFEQDCVYEINTRENVEAGMPLGIMLCEGRGMLADRIKALRTANIYEKHVYCHMLSRPEIWEEGDNRYALRCNFTVYRTWYTGALELFAVGKYESTISLAGDTPRLARKKIVLDPRRLDTLMVIPL